MAFLITADTTPTFSEGASRARLALDAHGVLLDGALLARVLRRAARRARLVGAGVERQYR